MLTINRNSNWNIEDISSIRGDEVSYVWDNPLAQKITQLSLHEVELLPIVKGGYAPEDISAEQYKQEFLDKLNDYQNQGYVLLDGAVVVSMLNNIKEIPPEWGYITESDQVTEKSATIRFDGSFFKLTDKPEELILTPFMSRGRWGFGYNKRCPYFPKNDRKAVTILNRELTAAIKI